MCPLFTIDLSACVVIQISAQTFSAPATAWIISGLSRRLTSIVAQVVSEFYVRLIYHDACGVRLCAGNPKYRDILIADTTDWEIWGKVTYSIRPH